MMDAKCVHPRLMLPTEMPQSGEGWSCAKLTDDRAKLVLEKMTADLNPGNAKVAKLTTRTRHPSRPLRGRVDVELPSATGETARRRGGGDEEKKGPAQTAKPAVAW